MSIIICADLVPTRSNQELFRSGDAQALIGEELLGIFNEADYCIANLETPLCDEQSPIDKVGANLCASKECIHGIKAIGINVVGLANNHIMDQGKAGLKSTIELLKKEDIEYAGAGDNIKDARETVYFDIKGKRIGLFACAEHEFSIASEDHPGANPVDLLNLSDQIAESKKGCDYFIVLYHGGKEFYPFPSPDLQKVCRKIVEKGANLVVCQHSHCIGSYEKYLSGTIIYGQGNFIFDDGEDVCLQTSILIKLCDDWTLDYIPIMRKGNGVRLAEGAQGAKILSKFEERSQQILQEGFIKKEYERFADRYRQFYLSKLHGRRIKSKWFRSMNRLFFRRLEPMILNRSYMKQERLELKNYIECEAHRELLIASMKYREK